MHRLSAVPLALRGVGVVAIVLLLVNPAAPGPSGAAGPPLVLLDVSLSMAGPPDEPGAWRAALDTARALARGGVIWRFGERVTAFDSTPPDAGTSRLAPALAAAAARGGEVVVVTDGAIADAATLPPDLRARPRVVVVPGRAFPDAFVAAVTAPRRVSARDSLRLNVAYGTAGTRDAGSGRREAALVVDVGGRRLVQRPVALPDSGIVSTELVVPASRLPAGWSALHVRLEGAGDPEPRDDARLVVVEVSPQAGAVVLASPPDWDARFLGAALADVAGLPVRAFARVEPGSDAWLDQHSARPVGADEVRRAVAAARLVVLAGEPAGLAGFAAGASRLEWPTVRASAGEWYLQPPPPSPVSAALAGLPWDSLPPATGLASPPADGAGQTVLSARLARRGAARPVVLLVDSGRVRRATVLAGGLWRWQLRGGAPAVAYRTLVAALADWLLAGAGGSAAPRAVPDQLEVANGLPLSWRWTGAGDPRDVGVTLAGPDGVRRDTLRFDAGGRAALRLSPGAYRYALDGGGERGLVAVETYSDEWRPTAPAVAAQDGAANDAARRVPLRDRWWLFAIAIAAFTAEWAWRRRQGLP